MYYRNNHEWFCKKVLQSAVGRSVPAWYKISPMHKSDNLCVVLKFVMKYVVQRTKIFVGIIDNLAISEVQHTVITAPH
jgi:hypothetical protein